MVEEEERATFFYYKKFWVVEKLVEFNNTYKEQFT